MPFYCYFLCSFYATNNVNNTDLMAYKKKKAALGSWFLLKAECPMSGDGSRTPVSHRGPAGDSHQASIGDLFFRQLINPLTAWMNLDVSSFTRA